MEVRGREPHTLGSPKGGEDMDDCDKLKEDLCIMVMPKSVFLWTAFKSDCFCLSLSHPVTQGKCGGPQFTSHLKHVLHQQQGPSNWKNIVYK